MPRPEEIERDLALVDAALSGEAVDPADAELAELALLLADSRPRLSVAAAQRLDTRIAGLAPVPDLASAWRPLTPRGGRRWFLRPAFGAGLAVILILAALFVLVPRGGRSMSDMALNGGATSSASGGVSSGPARTPEAASSPAQAASGSSSSADNAAPQPQPNGRRIIQTSQLALSTPGSRVGTVAQELFSVVGAEGGIVQHSSISTGADPYADFTLAVPTSNLAATLARLTALRYATVSSSTETSTDVNGRYDSDVRALADARALRSSLLRQLAAASTAAAADALRSQLTTVEHRIGADASTLSGLSGQISDTAVSVQINPSGQTNSVHGGAGLSPVRGAHDALDVLKVLAAVALIALAVLVPLVGLIAAALWLRVGWLARRRERVLDGA